MLIFCENLINWHLRGYYNVTFCQPAIQDGGCYSSLLFVPSAICHHYSGQSMAASIQSYWFPDSIYSSANSGWTGNQGEEFKTVSIITTIIKKNPKKISVICCHKCSRLMQDSFPSILPLVNLPVLLTFLRVHYPHVFYMKFWTINDAWTTKETDLPHLLPKMWNFYSKVHEEKSPSMLSCITWHGYESHDLHSAILHKKSTTYSGVFGLADCTGRECCTSWPLAYATPHNL